MIYGLSGASGTGKTTLGHALSKHLDIPFVATDITKMAHDSNHASPVAQLSLRDRVMLQNDLLDRMATLLEKAPKPCIVDRTPLDLIAYMLAEVNMHSGEANSPELMAEITDYCGRCINLAQLHFAQIFCLGTLKFYEESHTRPPLNAAYQLHTDLIIKGLVWSVYSVVPSFILPEMSVEERIECVCERIDQQKSFFNDQRCEAAYVH